MLRNTLITLSDNKIGIDNNADNKADFYTASVLSATDYYAFGMSMKERSWQSASYRYGFNGKENDTDWDVQDYGFRIYKPELGKFLSVDPLTQSYPELTPYQFASNSPISGVDLDGLELKVVTHYIDGLNKDGSFNVVKTSVEIEQNWKDPRYHLYKNNQPELANEFAKLSQTRVNYVFRGKLINQKTYVESAKGNLKSSASYDYSKGEDEKKFADDLNYLSKGSLLALPSRFIDVFLRDWDAPDTDGEFKNLVTVFASNPYLLMPLSSILSAKGKYEKLRDDHIIKRDEYIANPDKYDHKGLLQGINDEIKQKRIQGRTNELNQQIAKHEGELTKIGEALEKHK